MSGPLRPTFTPALGNQPSIPWRKPNVRHTSNELYVDIVESLSVIFSPSGRPISARATGSIVFTAKISGIPEILLKLSAPGGSSLQRSSGIARTMALPSFHPCVRLGRWKEYPGELSFVPPDGKFMLAGYEVDLLPYNFQDGHLPTRGSEGKLYLPVTVDLRTGLGASGNDFEAKVVLSTDFPGSFLPGPTSSAGRPGTRRTPSGNPIQNERFSFPGVGVAHSGTTSAPSLEAVSILIPFPIDVRTVTDFRPSRGDAQFNIATKVVEWKIPTSAKDGTVSGTATLTGTVAGPLTEDDAQENNDPTMEEYYSGSPIATTSEGIDAIKGTKKSGNKKQLTPRTISTSFTVRGWIPSGIKVESLTVDAKKSKGLGEGVKPYKGVKYICVSRKGVERRVGGL